MPRQPWWHRSFADAPAEEDDVDPTAPTRASFLSWTGLTPPASTHRLAPAPLAAGSDLLVDGSASATPTGTVDYRGSSYTLGANATYDNVYVGLNGTGTFTQSGGTLNVHSGQGQFDVGYNAGSNGTYNLQGGSVNAGPMVVGLYGRGTVTHTSGTFNASDSGFGAGVFLGFAAGSSGTYNLRGGTLATSGVSGGSGQSTLDCHRGTLQATADNANFMGGLTKVAFSSGDSAPDDYSAGIPDLIIDTNGHNVTVSQGIVTAQFNGMDDGGLRKIGAGTLTMTGNNSFTGSVTVAAGTLNVTAGTLGAPGYFGPFFVNGTGTGADAATLNLSGGKMASFGAYIGGNEDGGGTGVLNQSGGSFTTSARLFMVGANGGNVT